MRVIFKECTLVTRRYYTKRTSGGGAKRKLSKLYLEEILYGISCGGYVVGMNELLVILQLS